jgi:hypothetical protein
MTRFNWFLRRPKRHLPRKMSDKKQTLPRPALLVFPVVASRVVGLGYPTYWDQIRVRACTVEKVNGDKALVSYRKGNQTVKESVSVANLASTKEKAFAMLAAQFEAMLGLPALDAMTAAATEANAAAVNVQDAPAHVESQPQPLAGPRVRKPFSYADA